jgi:hypothetical protein
MSGLTAANVNHLTAAIEQSMDRYKASGKKEIAGALESLLQSIWTSYVDSLQVTA